MVLGFAAAPNSDGVLNVLLCGFNAASPSQAAPPAWGLGVFVVEESLQLQLHLLLLLLHSLSVCGLEPHWTEPPFNGMVLGVMVLGSVWAPYLPYITIQVV